MQTLFTKAVRPEIRPLPKTTKEKILRIATIPWVLAVEVSVVVALILAIVSPPMVHQTKEDDTHASGTSPAKVALYALIAGGLAYAIPLLVKRARK